MAAPFAKNLLKVRNVGLLRGGNHSSKSPWGPIHFEGQNWVDAGVSSKPVRFFLCYEKFKGVGHWSTTSYSCLLEKL